MYVCYYVSNVVFGAVLSVCWLCALSCEFHLDSRTFRLQKIVVEALGQPAEEVTLTVSFFAEIFTRVTVVS